MPQYTISPKKNYWHCINFYFFPPSCYHSLKITNKFCKLAELVVILKGLSGQMKMDRKWCHTTLKRHWPNSPFNTSCEIKLQWEQNMYIFRIFWTQFVLVRVRHLRTLLENSNCHKLQQSYRKVPLYCHSVAVFLVPDLGMKTAMVWLPCPSPDRE
jgi:hypothetical protein